MHKLISIVILLVAAIAGFAGTTDLAVAGIAVYLLGTTIEK